MATCRECFHYEICKITCCDETVSEELNQALEYMYSPKGCEHYTPKVDYVKRERGEWIIETYKTSNSKFMRCSNCKSVIDLKLNIAIDENEFDFCPYCNADMRKEDNNANSNKF